MSNIEREVDDTDNRDPRTTILKLSDGSSVEVNPFLLFKNMLENCPSARKALAKSYVDEAPRESDDFLEGLDVTGTQAKDLLDDFMLYVSLLDDLPMDCDPETCPVCSESEDGA